MQHLEAGELDDAWYRACLERMAEFVCAIAPDGTVVYVNPATSEWLGIPADELLGRSCLDFVHPDDAERAVATIAYGIESAQAEVPAPFRVRTHDGWKTFDVRGHGLGTDPANETMLIVARESNDAEVLDEMLDNLATGGDFDRAMTLAARQLRHPLWGNEVAVVYRSEAGDVRVAHTGVTAAVAALLARTDVDAPWRDSIERASSTMAAELTDLRDQSVRDVLRDAGFDIIFSLPIADPLCGESVALVVLGPVGMLPALGLRVTIERVQRLVRIALRGRYQRVLLERSARTDPLTGLANRRRFTNALEESLARLARGDAREVGVACMDLDDFKPINDTFGHATGDWVLCEIASRLHTAIAGHGIAARLGGDEFALLVIDGDTAAIAAAARAALFEPIVIDQKSMRVGVSIGVATATPGEPAELLMDRTDALAYLDKQSRKSRRWSSRRRSARRRSHATANPR